jgi:hypothetical protein
MRRNIVRRKIIRDPDTGEIIAFEDEDVGEPHADALLLATSSHEVGRLEAEVTQLQERTAQLQRENDELRARLAEAEGQRDRAIDVARQAIEDGMREVERAYSLSVPGKMKDHIREATSRARFEGLQEGDRRARREAYRRGLVHGIARTAEALDPEASRSLTVKLGDERFRVVRQSPAQLPAPTAPEPEPTRQPFGFA